MENLKEKIKVIIQCLFNPRFLLCFGVAWMITNGWSYVLFAFGTYFKIVWMVTLATSYLAILWFPFSPEKLFTIAIAIELMRKFFPEDKKTLGLLKKWRDEAKATMKKQKEKWKAWREKKKKR